MKKFLIFVLCFFCALPIIAQENFNYSAKILLKQDASAEIRETITFYSDYEIELPVLKRDIETDIPLEKITMTGNLMYLNFTSDRSGNVTSVYTLMNPFSREGKNTVTLSYIVPDAVYSYRGKDCFKFNLQLSKWSYKLDQATVSFKVDGNHITDTTLVKIDDKTLQIEEGEEISLTPFLDKNISLDLSFEQGFFDTYSVVFHYLRNALKILPIFVMLFMIFYSFILWLKYGQDPKGPFVTQYNPPRKITSAFAKYLLNIKKPFDYSYFSLTLISLYLKGYIEISDYHGKVCVKSLKGSNSSGLYEEDKLIYERLFAYSTAIILDVANATYIGDAITALYHKMENKKRKFFDHNSWYAVAPCTFLLISFLLVFPLEGTWQILAVICFTISLIAFIYFIILIRNISPELLEIYNEIMGFKQYMDIAESGRAKFANPFDKERLFCDNLDYAYAFGMGPKILKMFSKKIDPCILMGIDRLYQDETVLILSALMYPLNL